MDKLIKFLERNTFDNQMYWIVPQLYSGKEIEVQWRKGQEMAWRFRIKGEIFWTMTKSDNLLENLNREKIDLLTLESYLRSSILQQVVFAKKVVQEGTEIFGEEKVEEAVKDNDRFLNDLKEAIMELTKESEHPRKSLSEKEKKDQQNASFQKQLSKRSRTSLKLVKDSWSERP